MITDTKDTLLKLFNDLGIFLEDWEYKEPLLLDSLQFILLVVEIENTFCIEIGEEELAKYSMDTFNDILLVVDLLLSSR